MKSLLSESHIVKLSDNKRLSTMGLSLIGRCAVTVHFQQVETETSEDVQS